MKIIIGSESFYPNVSGVVIATECLAKNLAKRGHEVYVFAPSRTNETHYDKKYTAYKVFRLRSMPNPFRQGFRVAYRHKKDVDREVKKIKPDLIHLQDPTSICSQLLKTAISEKIPVVITNHFSLDYVVSYLRWLKPLHPQIRLFLRHHLSKFYNQCRHILCPTETVKKDLIKWGIERPITAISNGVAIDRFFTYYDLTDLKLKYHLPPNPIVLYFGRIDKDKSIEVLIRAIPEIVNKTNAHFIFAGGGDEIGKMKTIAKELKIDHTITWTGQIDHESEELIQIYQAANVFAIPSSIETQSIVTMEAMAAGLPIVGANAGALPELIKNGCNGYLFTPGNEKDLAEKVVKILGDEKLSQQMGENSLEIVSAHEVEKSMDKTINIYEEILRKI